MVVLVQGFRYDIPSKSFQNVSTSFITMVAIDKDTHRPNKNIPGLDPSDGGSDEQSTQAKIEERRNAVNDEWKTMLATVMARTEQRTVDEVEDPVNRENGVKRAFCTIASTALVFRRQHLPRHLNSNQTIFGGEVLLQMDRAAQFTASAFCGHRNVATLAMDRVIFHAPVQIHDALEMKARVVYVRRHTLVVKLDVVIEKPTGDRIQSHTAYFTVLSFDDIGFKSPINTGLTLSDDDQEGLLEYELAKMRHYFWKKHDECDDDAGCWRRETRGSVKGEAKALQSEG
jgi:acyl-CoA hydrolase